MNQPNPIKITNGIEGYQVGSKYLFNGKNYEDLAKEDRLKLLELVEANENYQNKVRVPHMAFDKKEANTMKKLKRGTGINHHDVS